MRHTSSYPLASVLTSLLTSLLVSACPPAPSADVLSHFEGGFDPVHFDAGPLPDVDGVLGRPLAFAIPPYYGHAVESGGAADLEVLLEKKTGLDVRVDAPQAYAYATIKEALGRGEVDVAELSPYVFALLVRSGAQIAPIAATVARGSSTYTSYIVVRADARFRTVAELKGATFGFVDPMSTSGFLVPRRALADAGLEVERDLTVRFTGSHPASVTAVRDGVVDAAAISSDLLIGSAGLSGPLRVIGKTIRIPYDVIVVRADLDPRVVARVRAALLSMSLHDVEARRALRAFSAVDGFMPVPPGHYDEIARLADAEARRTAALTPSPAAP